MVPADAGRRRCPRRPASRAGRNPDPTAHDYISDLTQRSNLSEKSQILPTATVSFPDHDRSAAFLKVLFRKLAGAEPQMTVAARAIIDKIISGKELPFFENSAK
jgi:hypothetical protein